MGDADDDNDFLDGLLFFLSVLVVAAAGWFVAWLVAGR